MIKTPIAIVGMGCRFPHARDAGAYWNNITSGRVCFSEIPAERWNHSLFYDPSPRAIDKTYARKVGLLDDVRSFAALHYGLAPLRVSVMDPQHRLLLDTVRVALEDAGHSEGKLAGSRTGVFVGASVSEYKDLVTSRLRARAMFDGQWGRAPGVSPEIVDAIIEDVTPLRAFSIAGNLLNMAAASVAQTFDFRGPAFTIDAACSSSLVATCDAVIALRAGICDMAIAGGVYLNLTPDNLVGFSRIGAISPSDACRPFDERADGFVLGEGVGAVVLKRLDDALRDRDRIYAVIRGAGINNDGRGEGPMTPRFEGQLDAIACAHADCDFTPDAIGFVEAHGTATAVGDATELRALRTYFTEHAKAPIDCVVSSVKANIGHTMSAAGVAGLIKASLVIDRAQIPPQAAFERAHPKLQLEGSGLRFASEPRPFTSDGPRRAAVSSFGFGGTNCHLVLEQAPATRRAQVAVPLSRPEAFFISAPTPELLEAHIAAIAGAISEATPLAAIARSLVTRTRHDARVGFVAATHHELRAKLEAARTAVHERASKAGVWFAAAPLPADERRIAMLFPGQGAQALDLCRSLYESFPAFRSRFDALASHLDDLLPRPLASYLYPTRDARFDEAAATAELTATEICQPAMAALGLAVLEFAEELGVVADVFVGHSLGEFVALAAGGALSARDALRFVARRGRIMAEIPLRDRGAMAAVQGERAFVEQLLGTPAEVVVANINHPRQVVISGGTDAVIAASARLAAAGAAVTRLTVSHAFHSPLLALTDAPLADLVGGLDVQPAMRTVISCVRPGAYPADPDGVRAIAASHATSPVDFVAGIRAAAAAGARVLVQATAGTTLLAMARATLRADNRAAAASVALAGGTDDATTFVEGLVELAVVGVPAKLAALHADDAVARAWLPPTPLPTEPYWVANRSSEPRAKLPALATNHGDPLVALFREQMDVLRTHAEIMRKQAEALAAGRPIAPVIAIDAPAPMPMPVAKPVVAAPAPIVAVAAPAPAPQVVDDNLDAKLLDIVAQVSAFPRADLKPSQRLVADLGFDSLMIVELAGKTSDAFPGVKGLPKSLFAGETTIADVIAHVRGAKRGTAPESRTNEAAAPLGRYAVTLVDAPVLALPDDAIAPFAGPVAILADAGGVAELVARRLRALGVEIVAASKRCVIDLRPLDARAASALELSSGELRDRVLASLAVAQALQSAELFVVVHPRCHAALAGFAKALAREWPLARVKAIGIDAQLDRETLAAQIVAELIGADATVEVQLTARGRRVARLEPVALEAGALRDGCVVAITGGARGIGAKLARELARTRHAKLALLGRSAPDAATAALLEDLARLGGEASYRACDVRDAAAVAQALDEARRKFGPIEAIVHAAGVIADAAVERKDRTKFAEVFDTKAAGWLALERATKTDPVRVALALTSWSGRFGNAEQTDYAAANHLVASVAAAWTEARPSTRAIALDLPPWDGTAMASTIPAGARAVMRARGVSFVDDASALPLVLAELEGRGSGGEILLGAGVADDREAHVRVRLGLASHPYLGDHRIHGVPVVPLATATDMIAAVGGSAIIADLELLEGLRLTDDTSIDVDIRARGGDVEVALASSPARLAYRARCIRAGSPLAPLDVPSALEPPPLALAEFYARHTFHGPRMRGITTIRGLDASHIAGTIRAARPGELGAKLARFAVCPLAIDASFQLAAYFMLVRHRRAGLPLGFDELRVVAPIEPGAELDCLVRLEASDGDVFVGHIDYRDRAGRLVAQLRGVRGAFRPLEAEADTQPATLPPSAEIARENFAIEAFPEYVALKKRIHDVEDAGIDNPYFNVHERITADTAVIKGREVINFSTYNYLGLSGDPAVSRAAIDAIQKFGTSVSASRIASGEKPLHRELELAIAKFLGCEDSIVMVGGHATNVSVIGMIVGPGDLVLHDSLAHDSILGGIRLSGARRRPFPHNDWRALDEALRQVRGSFRRVLIAIEGVYSMDGDIPDLAKFVEIKERHKAIMLVDEAHSLGTLGATGRGIGEHAGIERSRVELWMGTLSKSLASCGGYIAGSRALVELLKYTNPGFVYSVGVSPPNAASALAALRELAARPKLVTTLQARSKHFLELCRARGIDTGLSAGSAVVPCIIGDSVRCMLVANALADAGINVQPIVHPAVEEHLSRLRFFISARHTERQLEFTADTLAEVNRTFNRTPVRAKPPAAAAITDNR
ncbi:MAG TPA: aminotransferase class I/II-fold pyridoxal phosphate-dependent enzyme [Kofleriaceae bacterium]